MVARKGKVGGARPGACRPREFEDLTRITVDLERDELEEVNALAHERGVSRVALLREWIRRGLAAARRRRR
jgi:hypothetical protein